MEIKVDKYGSANCFSVPLMEEYQKRFYETPFTDEEMKSFKDTIAEIIQTKREELHSTIEQKIDKLISKK